MEMQRVWAVYFSGTGTTEKVVTRMAKIAAEDLGAEYKTFCFNLPKDREGELSFGPGDLVIFGTPVYAGRVPNLLLPYIRDKVKGNGALAVPVSLFGNRNFDDGLIELRNVLEADGFHTVAGGAFVGEHSFSRTLGAGRPDAQDMALVEGIIDMVKKFDIRTVAEGIESMDQVEYLKRIGCDYVQGYVFYRPMPQSDYEALLIQEC